MKGQQSDSSTSHSLAAADWEPLSAAALAGGQSRRMGTDKALLPVVAGGPPMLAVVIERLRALAEDVMVVAGDSDRYSQFGARVVPDILPDVGALGGIHGAIRQAAHDYCLIVACDMPFLSHAFLQRMAREPRDYDVLIPRTPGESRQSREGIVLQTLHAIYARPCLPVIEAHIAKGQRQVIGFFSDVRVKMIDLPEVALFDSSLRMFFNANTPEALAAAADLSRSREQ